MAPPKRAAEAEPDEEAFPRGGSDGLTIEERRQILVEAEEAVEKELTQPSKKKAKGGKAGKGASSVDGEVWNNSSLPMHMHMAVQQHCTHKLC